MVFCVVSLSPDRQICGGVGAVAKKRSEGSEDERRGVERRRRGEEAKKVKEWRGVCVDEKVRKKNLCYSPHMSSSSSVHSRDR